MGGRSAVAASVLEARGFRSVTNLTGGYKAWEESNR
jgi:rhodanese-related sulfurtransferase